MNFITEKYELNTAMCSYRSLAVRNFFDFIIKNKCQNLAI